MVYKITARVKMADIMIVSPYVTQCMTLHVDGVRYDSKCAIRPLPSTREWEVKVHDGSWYCLENWLEYKTWTAPGEWYEIVELPEILEDGKPKIVRNRHHTHITAYGWPCVPWYFDFAALGIPPVVGKVGIRNMPV